MNSQDLTPRQAEILAWIRRHLKQQGLPPTRMEIAQAFGFRSPNASEQHLRALARKGAIAMAGGGQARGIRVLPEPGQRDDLGLPLIGRVAAGSPLLALENVEGHYALDPQLFTPPADYLLRVQGMSMREAGILDGDLLAVQRSAEARNGEIVVARVEDEVTVKRFRQNGRKVWLLPENPDFQPLEVDLRRQAFAIEGRAVGVLRRGL